MKSGDILGHENMGTVIELGSEVGNLQVGDRVVIPFTISCGQCWFCAKGLYSACERTNPNAAMAIKAMGQSYARWLQRRSSGISAGAYGAILKSHFGARCIDPGDVLDLQFLIKGSGEKTVAMENGIFVPQRANGSHELQQRPTIFIDVPVQPADLIVLAIRIVVAHLGAAGFIPGEQHRSALRKQ